MATISLCNIDFCPSGGSASLQEKTAEMLLSETSKEITPDSGYDGMSKVTVTHAPVQNSKSASITSNGTITITPDTDYDAMVQVVANVNVTPTLQSKTATPSTSAQTVTADSGYDGLSQVDVSAVTSSIDANIQAGNIKKDVSILGVTGTLEEGITPSGSISISTNGTYDVTNYASANVSVGGTDYRNKTGTITGLADLGYDAASQGYANANLLHYVWENNDYAVTQANKDLYGVVTKDNKDSYKNYANMVYLPYFDTTGVTSMVGYFYNFNSIESIPILNTSSVTNMDNMFQNCSSLKSIPLLDTSNVNSMSEMFTDAQNIKSIPLLDTSSVTNMYNMFAGCNSLETIPLLDTSSVTNMSQMFYYNTSIKKIPSLDTSNVTNMSQMFKNCYKLKTIPSLDTSNVTNMYSMFNGCSVLNYVNGIDFSSLTTYPQYFLANTLNCSRFIVNGSISFSWNDNYGLNLLTSIDYVSLKSILTAMAACTNPSVSKTMKLNISMMDSLGELAALVADCTTNKGWTIIGLFIYTTIPEIYYTSTDGNIVTPSVSEPFGSGVTITSNTYTGGVGTITVNNFPKEVSQNAFNNKSTLQTITLPEGMSKIGYASFADGTTGLTTADLPSTINNIASYAFSGASNLTTVTVRAITPPTAASTLFNSCTSLAHIYVPASVVSTYQSTSPWSSYSSIISAIQ